jgi:hypothetical protein
MPLHYQGNGHTAIATRFRLVSLSSLPVGDVRRTCGGPPHGLRSRMTDDRSRPRPASPPAKGAVPSAADSWERHARIHDLVSQIRRMRALRLSPEPPLPR